MTTAKTQGKKPKRLRRSSLSAVAVIVAVAAMALCLIVLAFSLPVSNPSQVDVPIRVAASFDTVEIPTPLRPIAKGERLADVPFAKVQWPKSQLTARYVSDLSQYPSSVVVAALPAHLPVPLAAVSHSAGEANAVVEGIPEGMRAITVRVDPEAAIEGWARSGSYVDVIVLRQARNQEVGVEARVIAENVRILSAGRSTEPLAGQLSAPHAPATVTLLVNQADALKVKTAASVGKLTFALRGLGDESPTVTRTMSQKSLLEGSRAFIPKRAAYRGMAKGPDGRSYVLGADSRWVRVTTGSANTGLSEEESTAMATPSGGEVRARFSGTDSDNHDNGEAVVQDE